MSSVTGRIKQIKQPRGGYIKPSEFNIIPFEDNITLNEKENVQGFIIGMVVDYMTRFCSGIEISEAFKISLLGASTAYWYNFTEAPTIASELLKSIKGLDDKSIISACKLVSFDVWFRKPSNASKEAGYNEINPDVPTIQNIRTFIQRSLTFFKTQRIVKTGFDFFPQERFDPKERKKQFKEKGSYGGYTPMVSSGDGDFLTENTLWDFKVSKSQPTAENTLQILMYWIMGQYSGKEIFKNITKLGIFNPRLNTAYSLETNNISKDIIETVKKEVICYKQ